MRQEDPKDDPASARNAALPDIADDIKRWKIAFGPETAKVLEKIHEVGGVYTNDQPGALSVWNIEGRIEDFRNGKQWLGAIPKCNEEANKIRLEITESLRKTVLRETAKKSYKGQYALQNILELGKKTNTTENAQQGKEAGNRFKIGIHGDLIAVSEKIQAEVMPEDIEIVMDASGQVTNILLIEPEKTTNLAKTLEYPRGPVVKAIATIAHYNDSRAQNLGVESVEFQVSGCIRQKESTVINLPKDLWTLRTIREGINSAKSN